MSTTEAKILSFQTLPVGWHYGSGRPPTTEAVAKAILYANFYALLGFTRTNAFPGIDGEIMVTAYEGDHCVETTLELDGTFRFSHEIGDKEEVYEEGLSSVDVAGKLLAASIRVKPETWNLYASSIRPITMILNAASSRTWLSGLNGVPVASPGSHVLRMTAQMNLADQYALISEASTGQYPQPLPSFGFSDNPLYHPVAA